MRYLNIMGSDVLAVMLQRLQRLQRLQKGDFVTSVTPCYNLLQQ